MLQDDDGNRRQIGRNCLAEYIGVDAADHIRSLQYWGELTDSLDGFSSGGAVIEHDTDWYLANVCAIVRIFGYTSVKKSQDESYIGHNVTPTRDAAYWNMVDYGKSDKNGPIYVAVTDEDKAQAEAARSWVLATDQSQSENEFEYNLWRTALGDIVPSRGRGFLAYLPVAHSREIARQIEREAARQSNEFIGNEGERLVLTLTVASAEPREGAYGTYFLTKLIDPNGNRLTWFGSYQLEQGKSYTGKWKIKRHEDDAKFGKQTILSNPTKIEEVPA